MCCESRRSPRVWKITEHVPAPAVDGADAVAHLHAVFAPGAAAGAVVHGEHHRLALPGRSTMGRELFRGRCSTNTLSPP